MPTSNLSILITLIAGLLGGFGALYLKKGASKLSRTFFKNFKNYYALIGGLFYIVASILFVIALKHGDLSVLYPIAATQYIWASIFAIIVLKEKITKKILLGIILVVFGVVMLGLSV